MELVDEFCDLLQVHTNRDKVVLLACYSLKWWGAAARRPELSTASARLATARAAMRLFDDAAVIKTLHAYGLGKQEGPWWGSLGTSHSVFTLAYLQAEKLIFLIDTGVLLLDEQRAYKIRTAHKLFWTLFTFVGFLRSIRALHLAARNLQAPERSKCAAARFTQATLVSSKALLDVVHVVSWLPRGWPWGGALPTARAAGLATLSAVLGLLIHYRGKKLMPR
ncbi:peroxisomal membrane protein 11C-like [Bicyclus anynana]|uniref:Peroxisomal membrane protein 11C-like n=1 Tax=Bicyclus anynana TaxID=110368 RepID=A0A6J1MHU2_BICAN|nr:peroxisomal membrane protein 11C-like [Bicyclus anynana]